MTLPVLSFETARCVLRLDDMDEVRSMPGIGEDGSESRVLWRDDVKPGGGLAVRVDIERCGSSVLDELVLDVLMFANRAPWRDGGGGGGGGDLTPSIGS
jgi:hypothetical protein